MARAVSDDILSEAEAAANRRVMRQTLKRQGLPEKVTDPLILEKVLTIMEDEPPGWSERKRKGAAA